MFSLKELDADPTLLLDLKEDVREECSKLGEVTNVVLYDVSHLVRYPITASDDLIAERAGRHHDDKVQRSPEHPGLYPGAYRSPLFPVLSDPGL